MISLFFKDFMSLCVRVVFIYAKKLIYLGIKPHPNEKYYSYSFLKRDKSNKYADNQNHEISADIIILFSLCFNKNKTKVT